ncbi:MAG: ABC transporter ATP-binding protein [Romboutsia sp.]|nr:ABC transporter ATP-binding protein [Romboutsia sp.]
MIEIKGIEKSFIQGNTTQKVLKGISLKINEGDLITIMGPSGGGKSTLLYTLALLSEPSSGKVVFNNKIINYKKEKEIEKLRRKNIGLVFQNHNLISCLTALENIIIAMDSNEKYRVKREKAEEFLKRVGLYDKRNLTASALSGGEAQRIAIVRALVNNPKVILYDEPTGALDSENGKNMISLLIKMKKDFGCALIIVTHDISIGKMGDRKLYLKDGVLNEVV